MFLRLIALLCLAAPVVAASNLVDHDPELVKTRAMLVAIQALNVEMTVADVEAARAINGALSPAQLARWKRLQDELATQRQPAGQRRKTIFDFEKQLGLTPLQVTSIRHQITTLNQRLERSRVKIAEHQAELRKLHPDLGLAELAALPRPEVLISKATGIGLSPTQVEFAKQIYGRLAAITEECRRRLVSNAESLRPLLSNEASMERVRPFVQADAEMMTELTMAGFRASIALHEKLNPVQRQKWHDLERR